MAAFVPEPTYDNLTEAFKELLPNPEVVFDATLSIKSTEGVFSYIHKIREDQQIYFFANSSDDQINSEVLLKGKMQLETWNPHTGSTNKIKQLKYLKRNGEEYTSCSLQLDPVSSIFWIGK
jgi:hypothetical protein